MAKQRQPCKVRNINKKQQREYLRACPQWGGVGGHYCWQSSDVGAKKTQKGVMWALLQATISHIV